MYFPLLLDKVLTAEPFSSSKRDLVFFSPVHGKQVLLLPMALKMLSRKTSVSYSFKSRILDFSRPLRINKGEPSHVSWVCPTALMTVLRIEATQNGSMHQREIINQEGGLFLRMRPHVVIAALKRVNKWIPAVLNAYSYHKRVHPWGLTALNCTKMDGIQSAFIPPNFISPQSLLLLLISPICEYPFQFFIFLQKYDNGNWAQLKDFFFVLFIVRSLISCCFGPHRKAMSSSNLPGVGW